MAKVISDINLGRKITLELTEQELGTLYCASGRVAPRDICTVASERNIPHLTTPNEVADLYFQLGDILMAREASE